MDELAAKIATMTTVDLPDGSIGQRLKEERERLGYSQTAFAAIGEASKGSQISWEKGTAYPNADFLAKIAVGVGADVQYILTGKHLSNHVEPISEVLKTAIEELQEWQIKEHRFLSPAKFVDTALTLCALASGNKEKVKTAARLVLKLVK